LRTFLFNVIILNPDATNIPRGKYLKILMLAHRIAAKRHPISGKLTSLDGFFTGDAVIFQETPGVIAFFQRHDMSSISTGSYW
jgi:hypothetical protein